MKIFAIALFAVALLLWAAAASHGSAYCMSHREARAAYPHQHLYWADSRFHCWGNRSIRHMRFRPSRIMDKPAMLARNQMPTTEQAVGKTPIAESHKLIDVDKALEGCCWPDLDRDANGNLIEPPRPFVQRWNDLPNLQYWRP